MDIQTVKFSKTTTFTGRNGTFKCTGVVLYSYDYKALVDVTPVTSRGHIGNCAIEIPKADIPKFIAALRKAAK